MELLRFLERIYYIVLQVHNFTTAVAAVQCTPLHSIESYNSVTSEFSCEVYYLAD